MRLIKTVILILISSVLFTNEGLTLTNNEIIKFCKNSRKKQDCIIKIKIKRYNLNRGKPIEIPVIPYKK